jgi:hypothetical protein
MANRPFKFKTSTFSIWISAVFLMAMMLPLTLSGKQLSSAQLRGIQTQLKSEKDPLVRTKLFVLLINNAEQFLSQQ